VNICNSSSSSSSSSFIKRRVQLSQVSGWRVLFVTVM